MLEKIKKKYLFAIDLDGTLLKDSSKNTISKVDKDAIKKAISLGHIVCIVTGRPWRATQHAYETLNLNTIVANYNGAHIHNPTDYEFVPSTSYMNLNDVMYILGDKKIRNAMSNLAIEGPGWVMLEKRDKDLERIFGFSTASNLKLGINIHRLPLKPTGVIFDTKKNINILKLIDYVQRTYGDLAEFSSWSKGEGKTLVFDMTAVGVNKSKALSLMARFYDIPLSRTVAIGDSYNDIPMFENAEISVALNNAAVGVKKHATYISKKTNKNGGVASFINKFIADEDNFISKLKKKRSETKDLEDKTTTAH